MEDIRIVELGKQLDRRKNRAAIHETSKVGERAADAITTGMGSWMFIIIQTIVVGFWIVGNLWLLTYRFDPYPFILLNLLFSTQAAYAAPVIMMSQNRQSAKDRLRDNAEAEEVHILFQINNRQLELLELLHRQDTNRDSDSSPSPSGRGGQGVRAKSNGV